MGNAELLARLRREEAEARDRLRAAHQRFKETISGIPTGIPPPDGSLYIQQVGAEVRRLNRESADATKRLVDYMVHGVAPEGYES